MLHLAIIIPFAAGALLAILDRYFHKLHTGWAVLPVPAALFACFLGYIPGVSKHEVLEASIPWIPSLGLHISLVLDGLSLLLCLLITGMGSLVVVYSVYYMERQKESLGSFYFCLLMFMGSMLGVVLSDNTMVLYGFWELTSICSFLLIGYRHDQTKSVNGARKSLMITVFGGFAMLGGFIMLRIMCGSFSIRDTIAALGPIAEHWMFVPALILILLGAFTKSAQFPFHIWLPKAMEAPTPVSAYLHSATMVKAGIYLVARLTPVFAGNALWFWLVSGIGIITMCYGSLAAIRNYDLKAILAYSTISQLGMIMLLFGLGSASLYRGLGTESFMYTAAVTAAVFHLISHALFKGALFMAAGIIDHATGTRDIRRLGGLMSFMPVTFTVTLVGALSMAGLPPFNGFLSKEMLYKSALDVTRLSFYGLGSWGYLFPWLAWIAGIFTFVYCLILVFKPFLGKAIFGKNGPNIHKVPAGMLYPPVVLALLTLLTGSFPNLLSYSIIEPAVAAVLPSLLEDGERFEVHFTMWHGWNAEVFMTLGVIILGVILYRTRRWKKIYGLFAGIINLLKHMSRGEPFSWSRIPRRVTEAYMNGSVRNYLLYIFVFIIFLTMYAFIHSGTVIWNFQNTAPFTLYETILLAALAAAAVSIPFAKERITAVILTGSLGYLVTLFFVIFRAPDLALTQMIVETVSVALFLLCFNHLPELQPGKSSRSYRLVNLGIASAVGLIVTLIALAATGTVSMPVISSFFIENSYELGGGKNVVNVLLVDFRAFDTLLEIMVLGVCSLAVYALINLDMKGRDVGTMVKPVRDTSSTRGQSGSKAKTMEKYSLNWLTVPLNSNDLLLKQMTKIVVFIILTFAVYLLMSGHHHPGGGFTGGLVTSAALLLVALAFKIETVKRVIGLDFRLIMASGLLISLLTAAGSFLYRAPFMSQTFGYFQLPLLGKIELTTALIFDFGIFVAVLGVTLTIILQIGGDR